MLGTVVIVVVTVSSNVGTLGADAPADAISFPVAARLAAGGLAAMQMATR